MTTAIEKPADMIGYLKAGLDERFWSKVDKRGSDECWEWKAMRDPNGYGHFSYGKPARPVVSNRVSWLLSRGRIPEGMFVCHRCDNPPCCNPAHLFLGTATDNNQDRAHKGRSADTRGANHNMAKLTVEKVLYARSEVLAGRHCTEVANELGVSLSCIWDLCNRRSWTHV